MNGHTHLKGSSIASKAASNFFQTQTLTHEDVANRDVVSGSSWSVSLMVSGDAGKVPGTDKQLFPGSKPGMGGSAVGYARLNTNETFTTKSSIASAVNLTRPDLQAGKVAAMKAAERDPLATTRGQKQAQLNELLWNEPPSCDGCNYNSLPTPPVSTVADAKDSVNSASTSTSGINQTEKITTPPIEGTDSNYQWLAWQRAVQALQSEINGLNTRISAVDAKVYQTTITISPSGLHQPLLHTFDKNKATQELRDGVAVTAEFGKQAYKTVGDFTLKQYKIELAKCSDVGNCPEAEKWNDGGRYKVALNAVIGGLSYGKTGAISGSAVELAGPVIDQALQAVSVLPGSAAYDLLTLTARSIIGAAAGAAPGAASAFNATANNYLQHYKDVKNAKVQQQLKSWSECSPASCSDVVYRVEKYLREQLSDSAITQKCGADATCIAEGRVARADFESVRDKAILGLTPEAGARRFLESKTAGSGYTWLDLMASVSRLQNMQPMDSNNPIDVYVIDTLRANAPLFAAVMGVGLFDSDGAGSGGKRTSSGNSAAREGQRVSPAGAAQASKESGYVDVLLPNDRTHILYGDASGGGHLWPGVGDKTPFPQTWSAEKIIDVAGDIATSPSTQWYIQSGGENGLTKSGNPGTWVAYETRDGVRVRVAYQPATGRVVTAFPDSAPIPDATLRRPIKKAK